MFLLCDDSALRLAYKQLSFSRYAYDGEGQGLSPLPHNGDLSEEAKEKSSNGKTSRVDGAKKLLQKTLKKNVEEANDAERSKRLFKVIFRRSQRTEVESADA